ncbi:MAG: aspartyl protease family protein [Chitinophagales bacterium]|nr:aspartyl protease family protein [Chitinophagales bacterium]
MKKIRFDNTDTLVKIAAKISGARKKDYEIILAIDTGSYFTTIRPEVLSDIGAPQTGQNILLVGISEDIRVTISSVNKLQVGGIAVQNYKVANHELSSAFEIDGLLGNDFLRNHKLCIDYINGTITFE